MKVFFTIIVDVFVIPATYRHGWCNFKNCIFTFFNVDGCIRNLYKDKKMYHICAPRINPNPVGIKSGLLCHQYRAEPAWLDFIPSDCQFRILIFPNLITDWLDNWMWTSPLNKLCRLRVIQCHTSAPGQHNRESIGIVFQGLLVRSSDDTSKW